MMERVPSRLLAVLAIVLLLVGFTSATTEKHEQNCEDFLPGRGLNSSWTYEDCVQVWSDFSASKEDKPRRPFPDMNGWMDVAVELRRMGTPCLVWKKPSGDGVGSTSIRFFGSWILAEQLGCDWITPEMVGGRNGTIEYCHPLAHSEKMGHRVVPEAEEGMRPVESCSDVDWISYFQWGVASTSWPENGTNKVIKVRGNHPFFEDATA